MGTIVAVGGGCYDDGELTPVAEYIKELSAKSNPHVLYLPTAGFDDLSDRAKIADLFEQCGCTVSDLLLTDTSLTHEQISNAVLNTDIVYAGGGNLRFLADTWRSTGAFGILRAAYERGIIMSGYSSGAMCWFNMGWDDCGEGGKYEFVTLDGILDYCCCPHFESSNWSRFAVEVRSCGLSGIALENGAALVYRDGAFSTVCGTDGGSVYYFDKNDAYRQKSVI